MWEVIGRVIANEPFLFYFFTLINETGFYKQWDSVYKYVIQSQAKIFAVTLPMTVKIVKVIYNVNTNIYAMNNYMISRMV